MLSTFPFFFFFLFLPDYHSLSQQWRQVAIDWWTEEHWFRDSWKYLQTWHITSLLPHQFSKKKVISRTAEGNLDREWHKNHRFLISKYWLWVAVCNYLIKVTFENFPPWWLTFYKIIYRQELPDVINISEKSHAQVCYCALLPM